ncbi:MAG: tetratricopeptide repeat protein [Bryobacteraceae bacterium]
MEALQQHQWTAAIGPLEQATALDPRDPRPWLGLARARQRLGNVEGAVEAAARTAALAPGNARYVRQGLAIYHAEGGRVAEAERWVRLAEADLAPREQAALRHLLGGILEASGQRQGAVTQYEAAVRLNPYEETFHGALGRALLVEQRFADAIEAMEASRRTFAASPQIELILGVAYYAQRRFDDAVDAFLRTIRAAPDVPQPYLFLSRMMPQAEGRIREVAAAFADFHQRHPEDPAAPYLHAVALIAQLPPAGVTEEAAKAEALLRRSLELNEEQADAHRELGLLLERRRAYADAAKALERSLALKPEDSAVEYRLARIYDRLGESAKAEAARARHAELTAAERARIDKHSTGMAPMDMELKIPRRNP